MKKDFIGRKYILAEIYEKLKSWTRHYPAVVVLIANGGWGKSQIALEYARRRYEDRTYEAVFWVDASSEQAAKLGFARIWEKINPSTGLLSGEEKFEKACKALQTMTQRWLLVLDNFDRSILDSEEMAEGNTNPHHAQGTSDSQSHTKGIQRSDSDGLEDSYIKRFIPDNDFGHIIITSREKTTRRLGQGLEVELMSEDEAIEMLESRYVNSMGSHDGWDKMSAKAIVHELGYLPLAIEQVASNLACSQTPMTKFLDHYRQNKSQILQLVPEQSNFRRSYVQEGETWLKKSLGVLTVWEMSLIAVKREEKQRIRDLAIEILQLSGFLDRTGISIVFLDKMDKPASYGDGHRWADRGHPVSHINLDRAVKLLDRWHLIESLSCDDDDHSRGETFTVHPLVQEWIRLRMSKSDVYSFMMKAVQLIERNLARDHDALLATPVEVKNEIIRHIGTVEELTQGNRSDLEGLDSVQLGVGSLSETAIIFGSFYHDMGYLKNAEALFNLVKENHQGKRENQDPRFLEAEEGLALVRLWEEKGDEAYKLLSHARNCLAMLPKEYTRAALRAAHNLGEVECFRKNFDEAIKLFNTCLTGFAAEFGRNNKETHREREALGNAYRAKGNTEKAFEHVSEAQKRLEELDPTADSTVNATESLALVMKAKGELKRAEELYKKVIGLYERSIGRGQYTTLGAMAGLADTYRKGSRWEEAKALYREIMTRHEESLGTHEAQYIRAKEAYENITSDHPDTGPADDFSYPWPRAVAEYQTRPRLQSGQR
jgi:tetratricopeptide (TPR) repeat protein